MRTFDTGATRDTDAGKLDFEGFFSPFVMERFAQYMNEKRYMKDGSLRDSDNWQKGIPQEVYIKSLWRHFFAVWKRWRIEQTVDTEELSAVLFNAQGLMHESLKVEPEPPTSPKVVEIRSGPYCENCESLAELRHPCDTFWCRNCAKEEAYTLMANLRDGI